MTMMHYQVLLRRVIFANKNHRGADKFPEDILLYLEKEKKSNAILGPFNKKEYFGRKMGLIYPKVYDFIQFIKAKGRGSFIQG